MKIVDLNENENQKDEKVKEVREKMKVNKAAALGLAVLFTITSSFSGCTPAKEEEEEEDESYYSSGGGHYFYRGGSYNFSTWSKPSSTFSGHSYSSPRAKGIGG